MDLRGRGTSTFPRSNADSELRYLKNEIHQRDVDSQYANQPLGSGFLPRRVSTPMPDSGAEMDDTRALARRGRPKIPRRRDRSSGDASGGEIQHRSRIVRGSTTCVGGSITARTSAAHAGRATS